MLEQPALTLALVHGACVAGGCGLAAACDVVVAAETPSSCTPRCASASSPRWSPPSCRCASAARGARELLLDPEFVGAERAVEIGLANRVAAADAGLEAAGRACAVAILDKASSDSIAATKGLMLQVVGMPIREALAAAARVNAAARATADCRRGVAAFWRPRSRRAGASKARHSLILRVKGNTLYS